MAWKPLILALIGTAVAPASVAREPQGQAATAPSGSVDTKYCMRIFATGTLLEPVKCRTREQWTAQGVDVDRDWARNGVRTVD